MSKRQSNIELLRIVAIIMIVFAHLSGHGIMEVSSAIPYVRWAEAPIINRIIASFFVGGGDTGVGVFFLICGYFLVNSTMKPRNLKPLFLQVGFYSVLASILWVVIRFLNIDHVSIMTIGKQFLLPISGSAWWFISAYILLCLSSLSINCFVTGLNKRQFFLLLAALWFLWIMCGKALSVAYYDFVRALWFYLLGGYIRKHDIKCSKAITLTAFFLCWIGYAAVTEQIGFLLGNRLGKDMIANAFKLFRSAVLGPAAAGSLFLYFLTIDIKYSPKINMIASYSLGVYLLHDSGSGRILLWKTVLNVGGPLYDSFWFPFYALFAGICVFGIGLFIEHGRKKLIEPALLSHSHALFQKSQRE